MNKIIRFFKTAGVYFIGNVFTKLISFFLLPLYTKRIDPDAFGDYGLAITIINVAVPIAFFSIWDSVFRFCFDYQENEDKYKVLNNGLFFLLFGSGLIVIGTYIGYLLFHYSFPLLIGFYSISMGFQYYYTVIARSFKDNNLFVISGCMNSLVSILLNIVLIVGLNIGVESLYISYIAGVIIQIIIIERKIHFLSKIDFKTIDKKVTNSYLKFSIPVTVSSISNWLLNGLTQLFISNRIGPYYNGLYNVANKFASILILGIGVFQFAWNEMAYDLANEARNEKNKYYKKSISIILKFSLIGVSLLLPTIKLIYPFMVDKQYSESLIIIPVLMIGTMANTYSGFLGTLFLADKKSSILFITTLVSGVFNFIGLNILTPILGFVGSVLSLCLSFIFYSIVRLIILKKQMEIFPSFDSYIPVTLLSVSVLLFYTIDSVIMTLLYLIIMSIISMFMLKDILLQGKNILIHKRKSI